MTTVYAIRPGIASCAFVEDLSTGRRSLFIYMTAGVITGDPGGLQWKDAPRELKEALRKHFDAVFALPAEARQEYLDHCDDIVVETRPA